MGGLLLPVNIREKILKGGTRPRFSKRMIVMICLVALSLIGIFFFIRFSLAEMRSSVRSTLVQSVEQRRLNIDFRLRSVMQADQNVISGIYPYMHTQGNFEEQYREYEELGNFLSAHTDIDYISGVRLFVPDSKVYSHLGGTFFGLSDLESATGGQDLKPGIQWLPTRVVPLQSFLDGVSVPQNVLTCAHLLRQRTDYDQTACVLMLDVDISQFDELLSTEHPNSGEQVGYLVDDQGQCLAAVDKKNLGQQVIPPEAMAEMKADTAGCLEQRDQVYIYHKLETVDWYVVMQYPNSVLLLRNSTLGNVMQVSIVVLVLICAFMFFVLAYNITINVTLNRINTALNGLNMGQPQEPQRESVFLDPLHNLEQNADQMVLTVKELMENRYKDQLAIADSQMKSLQAQIKPHFLYNTLDIVKWMILDGRAEDAVWMVNSLSKYLRKSINKGPAIIPLEEELELSRTYLAIMQKRFENRFSVNYEVEESALAYRIPKLSIQPLLENALLHGVLYSEKPEKELTIRAWAADGSLFIEVEDNGNGMPAEICRALDEGRTGYGFTNVKKRLSLFSKDQSECGIFSMEGVGTCVSIRIPAVTEGESFGEGL